MAKWKQTLPEQNTAQIQNIYNKAKELVKRMINQGGSFEKITKLIDKIYTRHADAFFSFNKATTDMKNDLIEL